MKDMMNKRIRVIHSDDTIRTAITILCDSKLDTVPVVDGEGVLLGVLTSNRLYKAWLDGASLDDTCSSYIIYSPVYMKSTSTYDEISAVVSEKKSRLGNVPVVDEAGKVVGIAGNKEYLKTTLLLLDKSNALLESIIQAMQEGIVTVDGNGYVVRANRAAEKMFRISFHDIEGKHVSEVFP
jgi:CBS domain-containing protein